LGKKGGGGAGKGIGNPGTGREALTESLKRGGGRTGREGESYRKTRYELQEKRHLTGNHAGGTERQERVQPLSGRVTKAKFKWRRKETALSVNRSKTRRGTQKEGRKT